MLDALKVGELHSHVGKVPFGLSFCVCAGLYPAVDMLKEAADFIDRNADLAGTKDEPEASYVFQVSARIIPLSNSGIEHQHHR